MGLLWARVEDYNSVQNNFRHTCEQNEDMKGYGWERYDPRLGGIQSIHDAGNQIDITTSFFKDTSAEAGDKGGNWGVKIKGVPRDDAPADLKSTAIFYVSTEGQPGVYNRLEAQGSEEEKKGGYDGDVTLVGENLGLGEFKIVVKGDGEDGSNKHPTHGHPSGMEKELSKTIVNSAVLPAEAVWQTKREFHHIPLESVMFAKENTKLTPILPNEAILFAMLKQQIDEYVEQYTQENPPPPFQLYTLKPDAAHGNVHFVQKVFEGAFEVSRAWPWNLMYRLTI
jgi:mannosyl-oligosaccharide glucosidase